MKKIILPVLTLAVMFGVGGLLGTEAKSANAAEPRDAEIVATRESPADSTDKPSEYDMSVDGDMNIRIIIIKKDGGGRRGGRARRREGGNPGDKNDSMRGDTRRGSKDDLTRGDTRNDLSRDDSRNDLSRSDTRKENSDDLTRDGTRRDLARDGKREERRTKDAEKSPTQRAPLHGNNYNIMPMQKGDNEVDRQNKIVEPTDPSVSTLF